MKISEILKILEELKEIITYKQKGNEETPSNNKSKEI